MHIKLKRTPGIYLAGFMGSGKSTVGRVLADKLGWDFVDLDGEIETREQTTISQIFEVRGEAEFRRIESDMIRFWVREIERGSPTVIALGGGAFVQPGNFDLIANHGISIWIDCSIEVIRARLAEETHVRPLARHPEKFRQLFEDRRLGYARADFRVDGDCEIVSSVEAMLALPIWK
ncbi:MAG: shikimate kinase [Acidobacteriota bacterium]